MIYLAYLGESKKIKYRSNIIKFLIVRKPVNGVPKGFIHFPYLSPSINLLENAQRWKNKIFIEKEKEYLELNNIDLNSSDAWWFLYKPRFKEELKRRNDVKKGINIIQQEIKHGKNVYLFCYCKDLERCHRILVGEYLEEMGMEVDFRKKEEKNNTNFFQLCMFKE